MSPEMMLAKMLATTQKTNDVEKPVSADNAEALEKLAWADEFGRELAREQTKALRVMKG